MKKIMKMQVDTNKCTGCRTCELVCSAFHYNPKYGLGNPSRSRIRVFYDEEASLYVPVIAGPHTVAECAGRALYRINGKDYEECSFCRASCPSRSLFTEPDSGLPLKCDMCGDPPPPEGPLCAAWCQDDALIYEEREAEKVGEQKGRGKREELDVGLEVLAGKYGLEKIMDVVARMSMSKKGGNIRAE